MRETMAQTSLAAILALFLLSSVPLTSSASEVGSISQRYIAMAMQGDLSGADQIFQDVPGDGSQPVSDELNKRFMQRFGHQQEDFSPSSGSPIVDEIVIIYRQYWTRSMMGKLSVEQGRAWLERSLQSLLERHAQTVTDLEVQVREGSTVFEKTGILIQQQGFNFINELTPPLYDLVLWKDEDRRNYQVELTDRVQNVTVVFIDDFYSQGWSHFATFGTASSAGWAAEDALYCVSYAYNQDSENFRVSYLKHESRHFADFREFPGLDGSEREYRAKLTELAFAGTSLTRLLRNFTVNGAPNPESPHAYANYRVVRDLYQEIFGRSMPERLDPWSVIGPDRVNPAARALLERNTRALEGG